MRYDPIDNQLFIENGTASLAQYIGQPISAINDIPLDELLQTVRELYPSENIAGAFHNLIRALQNQRSVNVLLGPQDKLHLSLGNTSNTQPITVPFAPNPDFSLRKSAVESPNDNGLLFWDLIGEHKDIGYLAWNSIVSREVVAQVYRDAPEYVGNNLGWPYSFLDIDQPEDTETAINRIPALYEEFFSLFKQMESKGSKYLIIDLRKNSGGMTPLVDPLLYMLYGNDYLDFDFNAEYITKLSPLYLQKNGINIDDVRDDPQFGGYRFSSFGGLDQALTLAQKKERVENGYFTFGADFVKQFKAEISIEPHIIVLTSPTTFSAAYHFTYFLKKLGRTTLIGVASRQAGNAFMETTSLQLPNTKIAGSISNSVQILFKGDATLGKLLRPDIEMTWEDYRAYNFDSNAEILKAIDAIQSGEIRE